MEFIQLPSANHKSILTLVLVILCNYESIELNCAIMYLFFFQNEKKNLIMYVGLV